MSIRQTLTLAAGIMGAAALVASGWLSVLTTRLNRESQGLQVAVEGRHSAERIESDLLLLDRAEDAAIRAVLARNLRQALAAASGDAMTAAQAEALRGAKAAVGRYLELFESAADSRDRKSSLHEAYSALEDLVRVNEDLWRAGLVRMGRPAPIASP